MSLGLLLQILGTSLIVIGTITAFVGGYISPKGENILNFFHYITINQPRELYTSIQSVIWPSSDDKNLSISLDGLGLVHVWGEGTQDSIAMATNVVPQTSPGIRVPGQFTTQNVRVLEAVEGSKKYYFDTNQRQAHELHVADRKFIVKLIEVRNVVKEDENTGAREESFMYEYKFQIKEIE